ncbi:enolase-phosphatase E1-like isoform X2 [Hyposmocoma kahamanoa]|uniref:enolase-phosphatase E1-like isoform X2 n=1 Tax=Hyposmocoma kahamanoa TaxID=1477025 RepID=UPI000E6D9A81|nr:enolase-phosphatase E1-like isoform X2 [Hyposmocoma kahamanoa]
MREMKQIVEYLTEHNAYSEIRGRKMWVEFANSQSLDRTWQSLKETFMKRILPDIHNPYYRLTVEQISSFRQGHNVSSKNKLEVHTITDSSSNENNKDKDQPSTSKNHEEIDTGESIKCSRIEELTRSSTDTLVLENCCQNAEDTKSDQLSPNNANDDVAMKSLRDCIIYTEPLTPMLQEVLHDFDTDEDDEPKLQIVEDNLHKNGTGTRKSDSPDMRLSKSYDKQSPKKVAENAENKQMNGKVEFQKPTELSKIKSLKLKKTQMGIWENKDPVCINNSETKEKDVETNNNISTENSENANATKRDSENSEKTTQRSSTSTVDTQLPNNQEGLLYQEAHDKRKSINDISVPEAEDKEHKKKYRKREHSQTSTESKKKLKKNKKKESSTTTNYNDQAVSSELNSNEVQINDENHEVVLKSIVNEESNCKSDAVSEDIKDKCETRSSIISTAPIPKISPAEINPCLKSVSLFAEQFSTSKYSDSDNNNQSKVKELAATVCQGVEEHKNKNNVNNASNSQKEKSTLKADNASNCEDVVVLKSNSESDSVSLPAKSSCSSVNKSREKVLANLFGFSSARGSGVRSRGFREKLKLNRYTQRRRTISKNTPSRTVKLAASDEYTTTESDTESSRSRNRKNKLFNKYA